LSNQMRSLVTNAMPEGDTNIQRKLLKIVNCIDTHVIHLK